MIGRLTVFFAALAVILSATVARATSIAPVTIHDLLKESDVAVVVHIMSGVEETYSVPVYKAKVTQALKGATSGAELFLGGCTGLSIGEDYLVFLKRGDSVDPNKLRQALSYGRIPLLYRVMYSGYSVMEIEYACVFNGAEPSDRCQHAVKLNPEQILLPKSITTFPAGDAGPITNYKKWVRESELLEVLQRFAHES